MSAFEAVATAVGDVLAFVVGRVIGRTLHVEEKRAQTIGEFVVIGSILGAAVIVTFVYS